VRSEYRYASYRGATLPVIDTTLGPSGAGGVPSDMIFKPVVQTVRSEIVYKFNWNGPTAQVADLAPVPFFTKAPAAAAPAASWTGFYLGGGLGYGMWNVETLAHLRSHRRSAFARRHAADRHDQQRRQGFSWNGHRRLRLSARQRARRPDRRRRVRGP